MPLTPIMEDTVRDYARQIADSIIVAARTSGPDPIAWVTGNAMMPPLRSFTLAERIWQDDIFTNRDEPAWELLTDLVESHLDIARVALECPEWDNALYAVDLTRFEHVVQTAPEADALQTEWRPVTGK
jgi:hypothetical protein